eukprot:6214595-Pleurochrysis_carterae.AAC.2
MDPLMLAEANVMLGPSPGKPRVESNSIEILERVMVGLTDVFRELLKRGLSRWWLKRRRRQCRLILRCLLVNVQGCGPRLEEVSRVVLVLSLGLGYVCGLLATLCFGDCAGALIRVRVKALAFDVG